MLKKYSKYLLIYVLPMLVLTYAYLYPGSQLMLEKSQQYTMSDGTDPQTLPFQYAIMADYFKNHPEWLLYGTIPTKQFNAPEGTAIWVPYHERVLGILGYHLFGSEQAGTFVAFGMLLMTGLSVIALMNLLDFSYNISMATAIAVSFTCFSRARAVVHLGFLSLYSLPLIFIALYLIKHRFSKKTALISASCLLMASITCHYYLFMFAFVCPVFLLYLLWGEPKKWKSFLRLTVCALPAILLMAWSILKPLPADFPIAHPVIPDSGATANGESHSFVNRFRAFPVDFISGEVKLGTSDINPIKQWINEKVQESLTPKVIEDYYYLSNSHERTNGIRWLLLIPFLVLPFWLYKKNKFTLLSTCERGLLLSLYILSFVGFFLAVNYGLGDVLHCLINQFRVTNRAGIFVSFGVSIIAAYFFKYFISQFSVKSNLGKILNFPLFLPALIILELPPIFNSLTTANLLPRISSVPAKNCGYGILFPYINGYWGAVDTYGFYQTLRDTDCALVNDSSESNREKVLFQKFGSHNGTYIAINQNAQPLKDDLVQFLNCTNLDWISFHPQMPAHWIADVCGKAQWTVQTGPICTNPKATKTLPIGKIETCLQIK